MSTPERKRRASSRGKPPLFTFGVVSDIQYADKDDAPDFRKTAMRYYRAALPKLESIVKDWNEKNHDFALQLGDALDGFCKRDNHHERALEAVTGILSKFTKPIHHSWGNHEFYNFTREDLMKTSLFSGPQRDVIYYDWSPHESFRFIFYDPYDVSLLAYEKSHPRHTEAHGKLTSVNLNEDLNSPTGLRDKEKRFVQFNGAMSEEQLAWLRATLQDASEKKQNVILCGHVPLFPDSCGDICLLWNYDEVLAILHEFAHCIVATFAGHDHGGGYAIDERGIHHIVMPAVLESEEGEQAHAHVSVYEDCMELKGPERLPKVIRIPRRF